MCHNSSSSRVRRQDAARTAPVPTPMGACRIIRPQSPMKQAVDLRAGDWRVSGFCATANHGYCELVAGQS